MSMGSIPNPTRPPHKTIRHTLANDLQPLTSRTHKSSLINNHSSILEKKKKPRRNPAGYLHPINSNHSVCQPEELTLARHCKRQIQLARVKISRPRTHGSPPRQTNPPRTYMGARCCTLIANAQCKRIPLSLSRAISSKRNNRGLAARASEIV